MEASLAILAYLNLFLFSVSGLLLLGAINHYRNAVRHAEESRKMALRVLLKNKRI